LKQYFFFNSFYRIKIIYLKINKIVQKNDEIRFKTPNSLFEILLNNRRITTNSKNSIESKGNLGKGKRKGISQIANLKESNNFNKSFYIFKDYSELINHEEFWKIKKNLIKNFDEEDHLINDRETFNFNYDNNWKNYELTYEKLLIQTFTFQTNDKRRENLYILRTKNFNFFDSDWSNYV